MKKIAALISISLVACLIPLISLSGQDVKTEKKIKIVIDDGSGKKVIVDTVYTGAEIETIKLDNGNMIFISDQGKEQNLSGAKKIMVTVSDDCDSAENVINSSESGDVAVWTQKVDNETGEKVIVVKKSYNNNNTLEKTYDVKVITDDNDRTVESARFVVAKDGMVVTVEGQDEEKARELMKVIEEHLGVQNKSEEKQTKSEPKKNKK
ncbi:MAG TPA: hypothetical protein VMV47_15220 [Bacteroidales bacterium]|nr:hypothetical protein [Bacteroidales bacterium]